MSNWLYIDLDPLDGSAFEGDDFGPEVARILRHAANRIDGLSRDEIANGEADFALFDVNGNKVGTVSSIVEEDDEDEDDEEDEDQA